VVFVGYRCANLVGLERTLLAGRSSSDWDPGLTRLGEFSARQADMAGFVAADWGVANQMICLSMGRARVSEISWTFRGDRDLSSAVSEMDRSVIYVVLKMPPTEVAPETAPRILAAMQDLPGWHEVEVDAEVADLRPARLYKFVRSQQSPSQTEAGPRSGTGR
jgi:hypothetical protein